MKPESRFTARIHRRFPPTVYVEKMNNPYRGGTPDFWLSGLLTDMWVEYKWLTARPVRHVAVPLSALQRLWLNRESGKGRNVTVILGSPDGVAILTKGAWERPVEHKAFCMTELGVARWLIERVNGVSTVLVPCGGRHEFDLPHTVDESPGGRLDRGGEAALPEPESSSSSDRKRG